jgi:hypothetical protein
MPSDDECVPEIWIIRVRLTPVDPQPIGHGVELAVDVAESESLKDVIVGPLRGIYPGFAPQVDKMPLLGKFPYLADTHIIE